MDHVETLPQDKAALRASGLSLDAWIASEGWRSCVSVGMGIDNEGSPCLHLYVQDKEHSLDIRPQHGALPTVWETWRVVVHHTGPIVAEAAQA